VARWWWAIGAGTFLGVGASLMPVTFWYSVALVYIGLGVILVGLWFERFNLWLRSICMLGALGTVALFTFGFVLKPAPPLEADSRMVAGEYPDGTLIGGLTWTPGLRDLRVKVRNPTDDDYQDLDFTIRPDFPKVYITGIGQVSEIAGVTFLTNNEREAQEAPNGVPSIVFDSTTGHTLKDGWAFKTVPMIGQNTIKPLRPRPNHHRVRCEKLPHRTTLEITMAIRSEDMPEAGKIVNVWLRGEYRYLRGVRRHSFDETIAVKQ